MTAALLLAATVVFGTWVALLWVPVIVFAIQVFAARPLAAFRATDCESTTAHSGLNDEPRCDVAVLVPAHNEAGGIAHAVTNVRAQLRQGDRLLVVADNCSDNTAEIARGAGAEVIERCDNERRGKGYALDHGVRHLAVDARPVLVIVDADCSLAAGTLQLLAAGCKASGRPVQGLYLMRAPEDASLNQRVAEFAWRVKNGVRPAGGLRLGQPCALMGTGMAFPWELISRASLASGHLVEDMKLGIDLALAGRPPLFEPSARIDSMFPVTEASAQSQRMRWEHGHIATLLVEGPRLIRRALLSGDVRLAGMALDLMVPPITLLLGLAVVTAAVGVPVAIWDSAVVGLMALGALAVLIVALARCWWVAGRSLLSVNDLLRAPAYAFWKLPLYLRYITRRQTDWVRTDRHDPRP
jgi:cellulose synthase/poly-beta-1,6-N-acetylglucosamine synthase-like glycosyltransferase